MTVAHSRIAITLKSLGLINAQSLWAIEHQTVCRLENNITFITYIPYFATPSSAPMKILCRDQITVPSQGAVFSTELSRTKNILENTTLQKCLINTNSSTQYLLICAKKSRSDIKCTVPFTNNRPPLLKWSITSCRFLNCPQGSRLYSDSMKPRQIIFLTCLYPLQSLTGILTESPCSKKYHRSF